MGTGNLVIRETRTLYFRVSLRNGRIPRSKLRCGASLRENPAWRKTRSSSGCPGSARLELCPCPRC